MMNDTVALKKDVVIARKIFEEAKELSQSDNPISKDHGILVLCTLRDLLLNIDPEFFEYVLDYE